MLSIPGSPTLAAMRPRDICRFLVFKDKDGKTQVHSNGCNHFGKQGTFECGCPLRLSYKTVDSYIGKLRAISHAIGRDGERDKCLGLGNPAADKSVKDYLRLVTAEQLQARVAPKQAPPFFVDKLARLSDHIERQLQLPTITQLSVLFWQETRPILKRYSSAVIGQGTWARLNYRRY